MGLGRLRRSTNPINCPRHTCYSDRRRWSRDEHFPIYGDSLPQRLGQSKRQSLPLPATTAAI